MPTIPNHAITATVHGEKSQQGFYKIPFIMTNPQQQIKNGTTIIILARDMSAEWLEGVLIEDNKLIHGWIQTNATRNLMADGRIIAPQALPESDYAYNTRRQVYDASRYQKSLRGMAGIKVYGIFLMVFTVISIIIGGIAGVLFIQDGSDFTGKLLIGIGLGAAVGFGLGWIPAFIPMARNEAFQLMDSRFKALNKLHREHKGDPIRLESQMDLERAISKSMNELR
jgi:hypothetical protein